MNKSKLLEYLKNKEDYVKADELSEFLGVSKRQIRNYINQINQNDVIIESSNNGYKIIKTNIVPISDNDYKETRRVTITHILLLNPKGVSLYSLCDRLCLSESTIIKDLQQIKKYLAKYNLVISQRKNIVYINGSENSKRRLIRKIISNQSYDLNHLNDSFLSKETNISISDIKQHIHFVFQKYEIQTNDFCIDNIAMHLMIIIDRMTKGFTLENDININQYHDIVKNETADKMTRELINLIERDYSVSFCIAELRNLYLLIVNNTNQKIIFNYDDLNLDNLNRYVDNKYIDLTKKILKNLENHYMLDPFKENFIVKLTFHIQNLYFRYNNNYSIENPLMKVIKVEYPLIYDMAVYIAQKIEQLDKIKISEDEMAFISFHLGSYFELNSFDKSIKVNCAFIYAEYYDYYKITLEKIEDKFKNYINIKEIISSMNYSSDTFDKDNTYDLNIFTSMVKDVPINDKNIVISPFLKDSDINELDKIIEEKRNLKISSELRDYIFTFFNKDLYFNNPNILVNMIFLETYV